MQENVISKIYIDGEFITPHGTELADLFNPATGKVIGQVQLADEVDAEVAIAAAKRALPGWSATSRQERIDALRDILSDVLSMDEPRKRIAGIMSGLDIHYDLGEGHEMLGRRMPDLDLVKVACRAAVLNPALALNGPGRDQERLGESCLTCT